MLLWQLWLPCRSCCCSHMEIQKWNLALVLQPCSDTWTEPLQIPHWVLSPSPLPSSLWILCWCRPGQGLGFSGFFQCFHPEPTCTRWNRFPCQQDQSYLAWSSFSHGIWGVMAVLPLLVTGLRLHSSATRPKDSSGFGSIPGLPEAFFSNF